jgi:hypothetical protein
MKVDTSGMIVHTYNPALKRLRQENPEFEANLDYTVRIVFKKKERWWG